MAKEANTVLKYKKEESLKNVEVHKKCGDFIEAYKEVVNMRIEKDNYHYWIGNPSFYNLKLED